MKKNLWIWALAAFSMAACTSEDAPTPEQVVTENDFESPDGRIVVQLGAESTPTAIVSRAEGPVEGENIIALTNLGIFALNRDEYIDIESGEWEEWPNTIDNCLLKNVKAQGLQNGEGDFNKDDADNMTVDPLDPDVNTGKRITLYDENATSPHAVYYYPIQGSQNYNFYGYHPRQDNENLRLWENDESKLVPGVEITLDGNVDLITGEAEQAQRRQESEIYVTEADYSAQKKATKGSANSIIDGYNAKYIRKIKYSNWIIDESQKIEDAEYKLDVNEKKPFVPMISFKHRLTKLNFQIITAKEQAGGGDQSETVGGDRVDATELSVKDIKLMNAHTTVGLYIEPGMKMNYLNRTETGMDMIKHNTENTDVWIDADNIKPQAYQDTTNPTYITAGYLMVPATNEITDYETYPYRIALTVVSKDSQGVPQDQDVELDLKDYIFEAGKSYNIRIALYALQQVYVSAELTPWDEDTDPVYIPVE